MHDSPRGRTIEYVEGNPSGIISRGDEIKELGDQMLSSADTLKQIKENALAGGDQKGKAIEALQDAIGDSYKKLHEAGELYQPVGPVITAYGEALEDVQPLIKSAVDDSEELWATYQSLPGKDVSGGFSLPSLAAPPEEGSPEAKQAAEDDAAKQAAYDAWEARAEDFDGHYDTWESAFDTAVDNIGDKMSGSIKDGFWDNIGPVVDFLKKVLDVAALVVGIIALFAGGWVLALAAVLAFAVLALALAQKARGKGSWMDVGFAALGVLPFGKLTNLVKLKSLAPLARNADELGKVRGAYKSAILKKFTDLGEFKNAARATEGTFMNKLGYKGFDDVLKGYEKTLGRRLNFNDLERIAPTAKVDQYLQNMGALAGHYGRVQGAANHPWNPWTPDVPIMPKPVGVFL